MRVLCLLPLVASTAVTAFAQTPVSLRTELVFYGDNTEFFNPFRTGETILGVHGRVFFSARPASNVEVRAGAFGNQRFGSSDAFEQTRPLLAVAIGPARSRFVFGTLETFRRAQGPGPDLQSLHGLLPPIQRETLAFTRPYEAGMEWLLDRERVQNELWINWQRLIEPHQPEILDTGTVGRVRLGAGFWLGLQLHEVHHGGQLFGGGNVGDSFAGAGGLIYERKLGRLERARLELYGLRTTDDPDRAVPGREIGSAVFARAAGEARGFRLHAIVWRSTNARKLEGDPNYLSLREDGVVVRARRYAELGLSRTFKVADGVGVEASGRLHWIESQTEYSYRVVAVVGFGWTLVPSKP